MKLQSSSQSLAFLEIVNARRSAARRPRSNYRRAAVCIGADDGNKALSILDVEHMIACNFRV
jgi:hypothetical protein